jgi:hypothetical protein
MPSIRPSNISLPRGLKLATSSPVSAVCAKCAGLPKAGGSAGVARVIYLLVLQPGLIYFFQLYTKGDIADLAPDQKKRLRAAVEEIKKHHEK